MPTQYETATVRYAGSRNRRRDDDREDADRWLVSYADLITLLFALFVVLYGLSQVNESKYQALSESLVSAFGRDHRGTRLTPLPGAGDIGGLSPAELQAATKTAERERRRRETLADIRASLNPLVSTGGVRITESSEGIHIEFTASSLFAAGVADIGTAARAPLGELAQVLAHTDSRILVEGHADDTPIGNQIFASNWELSSARAAGVARLFVSQGVAGERISTAGYGEYRPVANNASTEGKARNRRVVVVVKEPCDTDCEKADRWSRRADDLPAVR